MSDTVAEVGHALSRLVRLLGEDFLRYVLSVPASGSLEDIELTPAQQLAVQVLVNQTMSAASGGSDELDAYMQATSLSTPVPGMNTSVINALRQSTGGEIEGFEALGDEFIDSLLTIARDTWPAYLVHPKGNGPNTFWMSSPIGIYRHPAMETAVDALLADNQLKKLFPHPPDEGQAGAEDAWAKGVAHQSLIVKNGGGGSLQLISLIPGLLANAVFRCLMGGETLSLRNLVPHVACATNDLRALADGRTVNLPALVGLAGVRLPEGTTLDVTDGRLRPARGIDRELFLAGANSLMTVFETTFPMKIHAIKEHKFDDDEDPFQDYRKYEPRISEAHRSFAHSLDLVRMALFLASGSQEPWLAREVARYVPDVLSHGGMSSWDPGFASVPTYDLPQDQFDGVRTWHNLVKSKHIPSLDIGMRRLLSAATMRTDPIDAFVDGVIAWETLFGAKTETTFRVTASIAKLLEPSDLTKREALHKELKDIYAQRSRLVHGGPEPKPDEVAKSRQRAIDVAADCFRTLYRDRPDLLELSSDGRGSRVLLE